jgi:CHAT domain-containing protein/Tfp pilus assembly protein PilF
MTCRIGAIIFLGCGLALAQAPQSKPSDSVKPSEVERADDVFTRARQLYTEQGPRVALPEFEHVLALYREAGDQRGEAITLGLIGNCHKRLGDYPKALDFLNRALALKRKLGDRLEEGKTLSHLGLVYWEMGDYPSAIDHLNRSIAIGRELGDHLLEASSLNNLGLVYDEQGDYHRSLEQYRRALQLYEGTDFPRGRSDTIGNIGGVYMLLGQYDQAIRYYQQSLDISKQLQSKTSESQDLGNLALCYLGLGDIQKALSHFESALALAREAGLKKEEADWHKGKGSAVAYEGKYSMAFEEFRQAREIYKRAGLKRELVEALGNEGNLYLRLGDAASAEKNFREAIELSRSIGHPSGVTSNQIALGELEWRRKRFQEADSFYRDALARASEMKDRATMAAVYFDMALNSRDTGRLAEAATESEQALQTAQSIGVPPLEVQALFACGEVARARGQPKEALHHYAAGEDILRSVMNPELAWRLAFGRGQALETLGRDEDAVFAYRDTVVNIENLRSQLREERYRASFLEDKYQVYVALVRLLLKLGRIEDAFLYSEKLRARSYLDLLNRGAPPLRSESQRQTEIAIRGRIRQLQQAIEVETSKPPQEQRRRALELFSEELGEAERSYAIWLDDLARTDPAYAAIRALKVSSSREVQRMLPPNAALMEYLVGENGLTIFVLTRDNLQAKTVPSRSADLYAKVELLRDLLLRRDDEWRLPAASLYRTLIAPIEQSGWLDGIHRLYLVPHEILHYVPFAALPRASDRASRFLVDDYVLAYLPAASSLVNGVINGNRGKAVFALAPARSHLVYAQQEAKRVTDFFPSKDLLLLGDRATEFEFKRKASQYQILHLATHGYFNKLNPLFSGVELEPDTHDDGRLEVREILGLQLHANLVTLSACDTALGGGYFADVPAGDDLVGLTRAFLSAGSESVLASLWEVNDRSTLILMSSFYGDLRREDKAQALAKAQREMLRQGGRFAHPYFWAPFVLVGQMN